MAFDKRTATQTFKPKTQEKDLASASARGFAALHAALLTMISIWSAKAERVATTKFFWSVDLAEIYLQSHGGAAVV